MAVSRRQLLTAASATALGLSGYATQGNTTGIPGIAQAADPGETMAGLGTAFFTPSRDGVPLFCRKAGAGKASILFVHGWGCHQDFFAAQFAAAAQDYQAMALDLGGHGRSGARTDHSMDAFAADVMALAEHAEGPLILVVHSAGGRVACAVARQLGHRLRGIIGFDCLQNLARPLPDPALIEQRAAAMERNFPAAIAALVALFFTGVKRPELQSWVREQMSASDPAQATAAFRAFSLFDAAQAINGVRLPVRVFNNNGVPTDVEGIRKIIPDFEATIVEGEGHFLHLVAPRKLNGMMRETIDTMLT